MSENPIPCEHVEGEPPVVPLRDTPPAQTRQAAAVRRQQAAREGNDTHPPTEPDAGLVRR